jgi:hypothetical protein
MLATLSCVLLIGLCKVAAQCRWLNKRETETLPVTRPPSRPQPVRGRPNPVINLPIAWLLASVPSGHLVCVIGELISLGSELCEFAHVPLYCA